MKVTISGLTDVGKVRDKNEDAFVICPDLAHPRWGKKVAKVELGAKGTLLAVADGMGGANAGDIASRLALESLKSSFSSSNLDSIIESASITGFLQKTIAIADKTINEHALSHPETFGMGTTIVICWILGSKAYVAWCGDSRCYVYNPTSGLIALTKDHSLVQELVDKGELTPEEAFNHPDSNIITRGLGCFDSEPNADLTTYNIQPNDVFLLCSDGLSGYCKNSEIENVIKTYCLNIDKCCNKLMDLAWDAGGYDNICIVLASVGNQYRAQNWRIKMASFLNVFR